MADERQRANLARRHPDRFAAMRDRYHAWNAAMKPAPEAIYALVYGKRDMR